MTSLDRDQKVHSEQGKINFKWGGLINVLVLHRVLKVLHG